MNDQADTLYFDEIRFQKETAGLTGSSSIQYILSDHLGSSSIITDENGDVVESTDYYPFGEIRINSGTYDEQRKFTSHEYDNETSLSYMGARYYDGGIGRFLSQDPSEGDLSNPQTLNKYSYVKNNPLNYIDPFGLREQTAQETTISNYMFIQYMQAGFGGNTNAATMYSTAYSSYTSSIASIPEGQPDPQGFTIMNNATFKWYDAQMGNTNWSNQTPTKSNYYSFLPSGQDTCSAFVGEVLGDAIGYKNYQYGIRENTGEAFTYPPNTTNWLSGGVPGFSKVNDRQTGDVVVYSTHEFGRRFWFSGGHAGIYFGSGLYISANADNPAYTNQAGNVVLKYAPPDSFFRTPYYFRY